LDVNAGDPPYLLRHIVQCMSRAWEKRAFVPCDPVDYPHGREIHRRGISHNECDLVTVFPRDQARPIARQWRAQGSQNPPRYWNLANTEGDSLALEHTMSPEPFLEPLTLIRHGGNGDYVADQVHQLFPDHGVLTHWLDIWPGLKGG
jgi:hypothetical protein